MRKCYCFGKEAQKKATDFLQEKGYESIAF